MYIYKYNFTTVANHSKKVVNSHLLLVSFVDSKKRRRTHQEAANGGLKWAPSFGASTDWCC